MRLSDPPPLGYIPSGSTNDFAASLELSPDVKWFERSIFRHSGRNPPAKLVRGVSILLTWLVVFALLYGVLRGPWPSRPG